VNKKCDKKAPKRIHKSEREKLKRDKQNDLFNELGNLLGMCLFRNCESINMIQIAQLHCNIWIFLSEICLFYVIPSSVHTFSTARDIHL
jgi:hypothetical protein